MPMPTLEPRAGLAALTRPQASPSGPSPRPRYPWTTRVLLPGGVVVALLVLLGVSAADSFRPAVEVQVVPVVLRTMEAADAQAGGGGAVVVQSAGWIEADPYAVSVAALIDGIVQAVLVLEGEAVEAGQVVATLVDDEAKLGLAKAEAELRQRQAELAAARRQWEHPINREQAVASAAGAVAEAEAELVRLQSDVKAEAARVAELDEQLQRTQRSYEASAATHLELLGVQRRLEAQRATLEATRAQQPVLAARLRQRQAELTAAQRNAELRIEESRAVQTGEAAVAMAQAVRDEAKLRLDRTAIRAPVDGVVLNRYIEPGSKLMLAMDGDQSATAVRLYDPRRLQVRVDVPLADAGKVGVGMPAEIIVGVLPDRTFAGEVTRIVHEADVSKNTLQVKVAIHDPVPQLKPEMLARVKILAPADAQARGGSRAGGQVPFVPRTLIHGSDSAFVWVVDRRDDTARQRRIEVGSQQQAGWVAVTSGASAGDLLIANAAGLTDGERVRVAGEAVIGEGGADGVH